MAIEIYIAALIVILPNHTSYISHTCYLASSWVGEDNLIGYLLFCIFYSLYMYGYLLVIIAETATCGDKALRLQTCEKQLLTNSVCLQALTVNV